MMSEITITAGVLIVTAVIIILTTISLVIATKVFSRSCLPDSGCRGGVVPIIPDTSSSSYSGSWKYDVFLSYRGEDTRKTFVDHLYSALQQHGILTYKDDITLDLGDTIGPSLLKAIEESQISVIIFSEKYADSSWCLDELTHIMKCRDKVTGQIVFPIFYHVDPSDVRKQKGQFGKAFAKHKLSKNKEKVESWKKALVDASNIAGWEPKHVANGHEAKGIQEIVCSILNKLTSLNPVVGDENLVGMGIRLERLKSQLGIGLGGVRMVGIWGVGGGGKTTLAISIYMEFSPKFDGCCFLGNIREETRQHGLPSLQEKVLSAVLDKGLGVQSVDMGKHTIKRMLCRRNVLIVLDDVDHLEQLEALAGCHNWFGNGSRIIITTRDEQVLKSHRVDKVCPISLLSNDEAMQLFKKHAYHENNDHIEDFEELSLRVISYVSGLPLALKILGSFLYGKDKDEWISTLARLKDHPEMDIVEKLKISYDGLKHVERELFLDIACFFRGKMKDDAMGILDACGFYPAVGVKVLIQKALITVSIKDGKFDMHDLVQEMAHYIVRGEHPNYPEKHSRVWQKKDIKDMCSRNATMENDKIEAMDIEAIDIDHNRFSSFMMLVSNIKKLRFLSVTTHGSSYGDEGPGFLSNELRYIYWFGYPASPLPESFQPTKLAVLIMRSSLQKELWKGYKYLPCLKELELSYMEELVRTPDIGGLPCLQKLILKWCFSLEEIHPSLGNHSSLVSVDVNWCGKLKRFPSIVGMENLEILKISDCMALTEFPEIEAKMDNLVKLSLDEVGIEVLPSSVGEYCTNLISLNLKQCLNLKCIEGNVHALKGLKKFKLSAPPFGKFNFDILSHLPRSLKKLTLTCCGLKDGEIPIEIGELSNIQELDLRWNDFTRLDFSLSRLTTLKLLDVSYCKNLVELPELPSNLAILKADWCESLEDIIRDEIHRNCKWLRKVSIKGGGKNIIGGERLLETMLQGKAIESGCISLRLRGLEIPKGFEPRLVERGRRRMQLPENWYNDFLGFLFCTATIINMGSPTIRMKHENLEGDFQDDVYYWEERVDDEFTWVGYIPFSLLRHTSWWDPTSTAIHMGMRDSRSTSWFGFKLIPKTSITDSSSFDDVVSDDYTCRLAIQHDSKSAFEFYI